ncbi:hypothetical protein IWZ01DRAFT_8818 [Phyllosticta capitalensis]
MRAAGPNEPKLTLTPAGAGASYGASHLPSHSPSVSICFARSAAQRARLPKSSCTRTLLLSGFICLAFAMNQPRSLASTSHSIPSNSTQQTNIICLRCNQMSMTLLPSLLYPSFFCSVAGAGERGTLSLYAEVVLNNQNHHHPYLPAPNQRMYLAPRDEARMPQTFLAAVVKAALIGRWWLKRRRGRSYRSLQVCPADGTRRACVAHHSLHLPLHSKKRPRKRRRNCTSSVIDRLRRHRRSTHRFFKPAST